MFLIVGDKNADKEAKCRLVEEEESQKLDKDEVFYQLEKTTNRKFLKKRDILHTILIGAAFFLFAWITMNMSRHYGPTLAEVEDQIAMVTSATVNHTRDILAEVEERSSTMKKHHELIASHFFDLVAQDLGHRTNSSAQNFSQLIETTVRDIGHELDSFESGVSDGFNGFVDIALEKIEKIRTSVAAENDDLAVTKLTAEATAAIETLLQDVKQMYLFYTRYLTSVLENKLQNATDKLSLLAHGQRRFVAARGTDRINLCYNVVTQNTKTSRMLQALMDTMSAIGESVDFINGLKSIHEPAPADENSRQLVADAKSALATSMQSSRRALDKLLDDDFCYLGSTVRKQAEQKHGSFKRSILQNLTAAVETLYTKWTDLTDNFVVVRDAQRRRVAQDFQKSVQMLTDAVNAKARRNGKNAQLENFMATKSTLLDKFDNVTAEVNAVFANSQKFTSESLHNYLRFTINRQLAGISSLSIQNFIPDDLCPLAMNYQAYVAFTLNTALGSDVPDVIDELFTLSEVSSDELLMDGDRSQKIDGRDSLESPTPDNDDIIRVMVVSVDDDDTTAAGAENDKSRESSQNNPPIPADNSLNNNIPAALRKMLLDLFGTVDNIEYTADAINPKADDNNLVN